ncbi:MAG: hypothetical protein E6J41_06860 [Chloroflexi bacterium]|nr:MAG: hypothetical protein E6J41_06860 [Chloroflexota bacterium]
MPARRRGYGRLASSGGSRGLRPSVESPRGQGKGMGVGIEFLILGPLDVRVDAQRVSVGGPKQRALLSLLLLSANHVVSVHQLIDNLWDDDPPATATAQVHRRVSELRRLLRDAPGAGPDELIVTRPPGYAMLLRPEQLDLFRFQEAAALAREAAGRGEPELAAGTLRSALALWRGDALGDVDVPAVRAEAVRLENLRLAALEARIDADLALGRQVEAAADLEALVAGHPYRERFRVQLVVALWRLGRRAEALDVQADTRRVLGELGLDPGPVLDELEEAPPPALPPGPFFGGPDTGRPHVVPRQLPPDIGDFVGRERQAEGLVALLRGDGEEARSGRAPVAVIAGPSGIGKTTLAVRVGHQLAEHFPDGQLYAQLRGRGNRPADPGEVLGSFLRALGVDGQLVPGDVDERAARFRTLLAGRRVLVAHARRPARRPPSRAGPVHLDGGRLAARLRRRQGEGAGGVERGPRGGAVLWQPAAGDPHRGRASRHAPGLAGAHHGRAPGGRAEPAGRAPVR